MTRKNVRTKEYRDLLDRLPGNVRRLTELAFARFVENPAHPALRTHRLADTDKGLHKDGSVSVTVTMQYRAIYFEDGEANVWYWIGSHNDYERFTGKK